MYFRRTLHITKLGWFFNKWRFYLEVVWLWGIKWELLFHLFPLHKLYYDVSVFIPESNVPRSTFSELFNPFTSIRENVFSLTIWSPIFLFPYILFPIGKSSCSLTMWFRKHYFPYIHVSIRGNDSDRFLTSVSLTTDLNPVKGSISKKMNTNINFFLEEVKKKRLIISRFFIEFPFGWF